MSYNRDNTELYEVTFQDTYKPYGDEEPELFMTDFVYAPSKGAAELWASKEAPQRGYYDWTVGVISGLEYFIVNDNGEII